MPKRVLLIAAAVLVLGFLAYVGVSSFNGSYTTAAGIGSADVTAVREGNALVAKMRAAPNVITADFAFTSGLIADRKSLISVKMSAGTSKTDLQRVVRMTLKEYNHGKAGASGAILAITAPGSPSLTVNDLSVSPSEVAADLQVWAGLQNSMGSSVSIVLGRSNQRLLTLSSKGGVSADWVRSHYSELQTISAAGFRWSGPGLCDSETLPSPEALALVVQMSVVVPVAKCDSGDDASGLEVLGGNLTGYPPSVLLGFTTGGKLEPLAAHTKQFTEVTRIALNGESANANISFFGAAHGHPQYLRFFVGNCASGVLTHSEKPDADLLASLKASGLDIRARATLGVCSPKAVAPSASATPGG